MAWSLSVLNLICIPQSTHALDQGGVEPRQAVSPRPGGQERYRFATASVFLKQLVQFLADIPKYWLENDGTMCLDDFHRWKAGETIAWLRKHGLHSVPNSIKADIGDLVYNGPKKTALDKTSNFAPPPGQFAYFTGSRASNDPPPGL